MNLEAWVTSHPYLQPVSSLHAQIDNQIAGMTVASSEIPHSAMPRWDDYTRDFLAGVPLLRSSAVSIDCLPAEKMIRSKVERLAASPLPQIADEIRIIAAELRGELAAPGRLITWVLDTRLLDTRLLDTRLLDTRLLDTPPLDDAPFVSGSPGLLRYVGWTVLSRYLRPLVDEFAKWRGEDRWLRSYCPTCGSSPAMAQLVGSDPGRRRFLACGCCASRWRYPRTKCPFCESQDDHRISIVTVEGEGGLRIDYCESCRGYLKTYDGEGNEAVMLVDWASIQLDVIARDRGLKRLAASLYEL
jgi:FdhE protein